MPKKSFLFFVAACLLGWTPQTYANDRDAGPEDDRSAAADGGSCVTQSRNVSAYGRIVVDGPVTVDVVDGVRWSFEISGCADQLRMIRSRVSGGRSKTIRSEISKDCLTISARASDSSVCGDRPPHIVLTVPGGLSSIVLSGGARMDVTKPLEAPSFSIRMKGMSRMSLSCPNFGSLKAKLTGESCLILRRKPGMMHLKITDNSVLKGEY